MAWLPISTAPRDGTEILASDGDAIEIISWDGDDDMRRWRTRDYEYFFPCAWQHLPDHPPLPTADLDQHQPDQGHIRFEFSVLDRDGWCVAGGDAPTYAEALRESQHYLAQYQQDGPHTLELRRVELLSAAPAGPARPPLWQAMEGAFFEGRTPGHCARFGYAAEIRAVRDWLHQHSNLQMKVATFHQIYDLLTAEVERAERGT